MKKDAQEAIKAFKKFLKKVNKVSDGNRIFVSYDIQVNGDDWKEIVAAFNEVIQKHGRLLV